MVYILSTAILLKLWWDFTWLYFCFKIHNNSYFSNFIYNIIIYCLFYE